MPKTPKKKRRLHRDGVRHFIRRLLVKNRKLETPDLRKKAKAKFGYTPEIDRHFPQLVYEIRKQLKIKIKVKRAG